MTQQAHSLRAEPAAQPPAPPARLAPPLQLARRWGWRESLLLLALVAVWLAVRPWSGIWHDGRLYAAQAMHLLYPEQFENDLFFMFGSQDKFTLFSPLYSACIQAFGLDGGSLLLQLAGSALWLGGACFLLSTFLRGPMLWVALAWLLLLPTDYDPIKSFSLAEPYLTPRILAEALSMLALACLLRGKRLWPALFMTLSLVMHPLMTIATLLFCALYLVSGGIRQAVPLLVAGAILAVAGIALDLLPYQRLLQAMDAEWYAEVARMSVIVTWDGWRFGEMASRTTVAFSLVLMAARLSAGWRARFYYCVALVGGLGLLASWLGTSVFHNLLLLQIQPWRAMWLVQLVAVIAMGWLLAAFWHRGRLFQFLLATIMLGVFARDSFGGLVTLAAGAALCWLVSQPAPKPVSNRTYGLLCCLLLAMLSIWLAQVDAQATTPLGVRHWNYAVDVGSGMGWGLSLLRLGGGAVLGLALMLGIWHCAGRRKFAGWALAAGMALLAVTGAALLRQGYSANRLQISAAGERAVRAAFVPLIPRQATVYWENELRASWFVLQRSSYASVAQTYGMVFNRGNALEGARRLHRLERLAAPDVVLGKNREDSYRMLADMKQPGTEELAYACADVALDFVVLTQKMGALAVAQADDPAFDRSYFLYDCARLRGSYASH
ncbi:MULTISPECIES: hypothetical protein [unclassified Duganella]|uniref:hypothetical protein n=1 Tax=unclassified Duganella TaxID=2636909 RepID=UPI0007010ACE|nr:MULTISPECIES: hypothetical protein [unclassified Duganella]KQV47500.1 hypothetical protein ASD07_11190 [Duganella sp. Root336D2]KRC00084.1 hypothetical protein ASE26_23945 [Duganella sp. Root198D2]